jgi:signal transduction histidine kinase
VWAVCFLVIFPGAMVLGIRNGSLSQDPMSIVLSIGSVTGYAAVGALVASRSSVPVIGWLMLVIGVGFLLSAAAAEYVIYAYRTDPGGLPLGSAAAWLWSWIDVAGIISVLFLLLLFPTGRVPSRRWRSLPPVIGLSSLVAVAGQVVRPAPIEPTEGVRVPNPTAVPELGGAADAMLTAAAFVLIPAAIACAVAPVLRFRRSTGVERQQIRWLAFAVALGGVALVVVLVSGMGLGPNETVVNDVAFFAFFACVAIGIPIAAGVAILRYRLYALDLVVRKTLVFGLLVVSASIAYGAVVVSIGFLVGERNTPLSMFALGIALGTAFPLFRRQATRLADRIVYGRRATPYEVLSGFAERVARTYASEDVLPRMAQILAQGTGAEVARVWLLMGRELRAEATWPPDGGPAGPARVAGDALPELPGGERAFEVRHQGELLGALSLRMPQTDSLDPARERLVADLASQAGLVLRNVRLIQELRGSRRRLVAAQDEERRRIERNLHDGAQQQLVALAVKQRLAASLVGEDDDRALRLLEELQAEASEALESLRDLARGIYPPLLADRGLPAALEAQARKAPLPVRVEAGGVGRYPREVESAVYFCVLEALQNAAKYARAEHVMVRLSAGHEELRFEVSDDGAGFDPGSAHGGTGLRGMADRVEAVGGSLQVRSAPGSGTSVVGRVPVVTGGTREDGPHPGGTTG